MKNTATLRTRSEPWTIVGAAGGPRASSWRRAAREVGVREPTFLSYAALAREPVRVADVRGPLRFDSYGRDLAARMAFHQRGADSPLDLETLRAELGERGRVVAPDRMHRGFMRTLRDVAAHAPRATLVSDPDDIELAYHKSRCNARLAEAGISVPRGLGVVSGWDELSARMQSTRARRVFLKMEHGSSAAAMAAIAVGPRGAVARTTAELAGLRLYQTRRVREVRGVRQVARLVDAVARHAACAERWFPKACIDGLACDLRVVTVSGAITHVVLRRSSSPFTNLHLGGRRSGAEPLRGRVPARAWDEMLASVERIARVVFHRSQTIGVDVAVNRAGAHAVLEVNAFGDLLGGVVDAHGRSPQAAQLEAWR